MKFKLVEGIDRGLETQSSVDTLNEATTPQYRTILFNIIAHVTSNNDLKQLLSNASSHNNIEIHHIDGEYEEYKTKSGNVRKRAAHNEVSNLAILSKRAHQQISHKQKSLDEIAQEEPVYMLADCLPELIVNAIEDVI